MFGLDVSEMLNVGIYQESGDLKLISLSDSFLSFTLGRNILRILIYLILSKIFNIAGENGVSSYGYRNIRDFSNKFWFVNS